MAEHNLHALAFPVLEGRPLAQLANCATVVPKHYRDGETLITVGDRLFKFFVVTSREIEIIDHSGEAPRTLAIDRKGQFTGEISHLTGTPAIISAIARGDCQVLEVSAEALCRGCVAIVVGGGNSAGQAAVFLAEHASRVVLLIRGDDLNGNMSSYLARRIEQTTNIELLCNTVIRQMVGNGHLQAVQITNSRTGEQRTVEMPAVFSLIGATPRTDWLPSEIERDAKGFIRTGMALSQSPSWGVARPPFLLETSHPGVFAAGDVRAGSVKRVASAVGEGAMAVQFVHEYLKGM